MLTQLVHKKQVTHSIFFHHVQALGEANKRVRDATAAAAAAEKKLAALEVGIPKARMEADSQRQLAKDLRARLTQLKAATRV